MVKQANPEFRDVCTIVGLMTITWAWADNALTLAVGIIDENVQSMRGFKEIPRSHKQRLQYLRNALKDVSRLEPVKERGEALVESFVKLAVRRNDVVHSSIGYAAPGDLQALSFTLAARQQTGNQESFDIARTVALTGEIKTLADHAVAFADDIARLHTS